jgi:hypothetical protein
MTRFLIWTCSLLIRAGLTVATIGLSVRQRLRAEPVKAPILVSPPARYVPSLLEREIASQFSESDVFGVFMIEDEGVCAIALDEGQIS